MADHNDVVRESFSKQTKLFSGENAIFSRRAVETRTWLDPLEPDSIVLDVACGAGHAAELAAPYVRQVVGVDLTPALLEEGRTRFANNGINNVLLLEGDATNLNFVDASFDVVFCRAALHHMQHPDRAVAEMARVCKPGGRVSVSDMVAAGPDVRDAFDALHRVIDPSHVHCFLEPELEALVEEKVGGASFGQPITPLTIPVSLMLTNAGDPDAAMAELRAELSGGARTGFNPTQDGDDVIVSFTSAIVSAYRTPAPAQ